LRFEMHPGVSAAELDEVLALQVTIAWAGEGLCSPPRLGWWRTDLVDPAGGGDLIARLMPKTARWAVLEAVREVARRADERARLGMAEPERLRTLFHFGFHLDERLAQRLLELKRLGQPPEEALPGPPRLGPEFDRDSFVEGLRLLDKGGFSTVPGGRELRGPLPSDLPDLARRLVAALAPLAPTYPVPFYRARS